MISQIYLSQHTSNNTTPFRAGHLLKNKFSSKVSSRQDNDIVIIRAEMSNFNTDGEVDTDIRNATNSLLIQKNLYQDETPPMDNSDSPKFPNFPAVKHSLQTDSM